MPNKRVKQQSIARRLIVSVMLIQLVSAAGIVAATVAYERHTRFQAFDIMLRGHADSLLAAVQDADDESDNVRLDRTNLQTPAEDIYEVKEGSNRILGRSENWKAGLSAGPMQPDGIVRARIGGRDYRLIHIHGVRVVDPEEVKGGTTHTVSVLYGAPTSDVWKRIGQAVAFYTAASCLLLILTGLLVFWLLQRGLSPLHELAAEAERISAQQWSFNPPESARRTTELAPLSTALESAVRRLEQSFDQQRRFVSDAAHELKTAAAVIKSSLQLLTMRPRSAADYETGLSRSLADCERMEEIVAKMLTLARLENPLPPGTRERATDLESSARKAAMQLQPFAELQGITVRVVSAEPCYALASAEECLLLCSNLLMNALQHSRRSGEITLSTRVATGGWIELRVTDHGEGIDEATLPHVFERFYRGDPSRTRGTGGTGLGLAICRAITQRAGGTIHLESTVGVGTTAILRLPEAEGPVSAAPSLPVAAGISSA